MVRIKRNSPYQDQPTNDYTKLVDFEQRFRLPGSDDSNTKTFLKSLVTDYVKTCSVRKSIAGRFPVIQLFRTYRWKNDLIKDVISGVMSGVMMIPLGLAYASLSTLPNIVGLYMSFFASISYFIFGTSRHLTWGCVAVISLMTANIMYKYDNSDDAKSFINSLNRINTDTPLGGFGELGDAILSNLKVRNESNEHEILAAISDRRIEVASSVAVLTGVVFVVQSMIGLDFITALLSNSLIAGFTVGVAFNIATNQINGILGLSVERFSGNFWIFRTWVNVMGRVQETNVAVLVISLICIVVAFILKRFVNERYKHKMWIPIPVELLLVIVGILVSKYSRLHDNYDVTIMGPVPKGIPRPKLPDVSLVLSIDYVVYSMLIAFVANVQSLAVAKTLAQENSRSIRAGQEMFAAGMGSIVCGLFSGYVPSAYVPISIAQRDSGGVSQMASIFAAGVVLLVITVFGPYLHDLPECVMSAIILVNLIPLFLQIKTVPEEWRRSKYDSLIWIFAFLATVILEMGNALIISVCFSIFLVLLRAMIKPVVEVLPIQAHQRGMMQLRRPGHYVSTKTLLTIKLMKVKTALYFFNVDAFVDALFSSINLNSHLYSRTLEYQNSYAQADDETTHLISSAKRKASSFTLLKTLILDISGVSFIDVMGVDTLSHVIKVFDSMGITVIIVSIPENLFGILASTGFWREHGDRLFIDVGSALDYVFKIPDTDDIDTKVKGLGKDTGPQIDQWV